MKHILVTGGAGYVGSMLVPALLADKYKVTVIDLFLFGDHLPNHDHLEKVKGDIRDVELVRSLMNGIDAVIHLACISNDPSYELNPALGKSINYDAFLPMVLAAKESGVSRFIYASSSSVYGVKDVENVSEDLALEPLTDYSKYKALCEDVLLKHASKYFTALILRPATVCGYSPRLRLDLTVNILTHHAWEHKRIRVFGGGQKRPNIHIGDMVDLYLKSLQFAPELIAGKIFNAGYENHTVREIADIVKKHVGDPTVEIVCEPTQDHRSYHISSAKIEKELGFKPVRSIGQAVDDLCLAFRQGRIPNASQNKMYYNIKTMQEVQLT